MNYPATQGALLVGNGELLGLNGDILGLTERAS
jgi:hypothetical protein